MGGQRVRRATSNGALESALQAIQVEVDDWCREQREQLAQDETAYDGDAQRPAKFGAGAGPQCQRQGTEKGRHCRHKNWPEA